MKFHVIQDVRLSMPRAALMAIFDECDRYDHDETGGRVIGTFQEEGGKLALFVTGVIESGPRAQRTAVSFFQDGEHQEGVFREIELNHPEIEHLGNWHTHHVNGLSTLSRGDITTYRRTVDHQNHNTPFFYALLVTNRRDTTDPLERYGVKHYLFRRHDECAYEIPHELVEITDGHLVWPVGPQGDIGHGSRPTPAKFGARPERVYDRDILRDFYPGIRSFASQKLGFYWRGTVALLDGSTVQVVLVEDSSSHPPSYSLVLREAPDALRAVADRLAKQEFPSARAALIVAERSCNRALYEQRSGPHEVKPSN